VILALTCRRFGRGYLNDTGSSLMEDTAHQIICNAKQEEKEALPKLANQSYIELYSELEKYREPRIFNQLIGDRFSYIDNDKSHIKLSVPKGNRNLTNTAICNHVMRAGRHYITFTREGIEGDGYFGIIRPLKNWDKKGLDCLNPLNRGCFPCLQEERTERWSGDVNYCSVAAGFGFMGGCLWHDWRSCDPIDPHDWEGSEGFVSRDEIGMVLDLDAGTLCVYRNGRRLGIMKDGLSGDYCWTTTIWSHGEGVSIKKGAIPI